MGNINVDLSNGTLTIRDEIAKNGRAVCLPLNTWLIERFAQREKSDSPYVFANPVGGYIRNLRRPLELVGKVSGIAITPHDLRRSFATYLDAIGTPFGAIKQLLNHSSSADVTQRYIQDQSPIVLRRYTERLLALFPQCSLVPDHK